MYAICRRDQAGARRVRRPLRHRQALHRAIEDCSNDPNIDAVHINSPDRRPRAAVDRGAEGRQARRLHGADGDDASTSAGRSSRRSGRRGKVYMMMETVVYAREYLFVKELYDKGELGRIQFLRGSHQQDMDGWPGYWPGLPPMHYATHCVSPCLAILGNASRHAESVVCHGSGRIREELIAQVRQPVRDRDGDVQDQGQSDVVRRGDAQPVRHGPAVSRELRRLRHARSRSSGSRSRTRSRSSTPRARRSPLPEPEIPKRVKVPDYAHLLPEPIQRFTQPAAIQDAEHLSFLQGGGHGGSHPHLVHNFLMACLGRKRRCPTPRRRRTGRWSASAPTSRR